MYSVQFSAVKETRVSPGVIRRKGKKPSQPQPETETKRPQEPQEPKEEPMSEADKLELFRSRLQKQIKGFKKR